MLNAFRYTQELASVLGEVAECHAFERPALTWLLDWVLARWSLFGTRWRADGFLTQDARALISTIRAERAALRLFIDAAGGRFTVDVLEKFEENLKEVSP